VKVLPLHRKILAVVLLPLLLVLALSASSSVAGGEAHPEAVSKPDLTPLGGSSPMSYTAFLPLVSHNHIVRPLTIFGVQMYGLLATQSAGLPLTEEAQVYWVRWPLAWSAVEPVNTEPEGYRFYRYDSDIAAADSEDLHLVVTILSNPDWAATYRNGPIDKVDISEFAEFMGALVERYDGDGWQDAPGSPVVDYWEFYNEPDAGDELRAEYGASYWGHFGAEYAEMLCAVYPAMKSANPQAQVVLGGLAYDAFEDQGGGFVREFLDDVLTAGGGECFDVMNFHYYPVFGWSSYGPGLSGKANYLAAKLEEYGYEKPIICTEAGWHSDDYGQFPSTPEIQSRYVVKLFAQSLASRLDMMIWWTWIDPGAGYGKNGLLTQALERKPAFYAYAAAARILGMASFRRPLSSGELGSQMMEGYLLTSLENRDLYVLWSNDGNTRAVSLPLPRANVTDLYGNPVSVVEDIGDGHLDGRIEVTVGANPTYVEAAP